MRVVLQHRWKLSTQHGAGLLEVMLTVFIISIGFLAIAALQLQSMRMTHTAHLRSVAALKAYEMADMIRANMEGFEAGYYDNVDTPATINRDNDKCRDRHDQGEIISGDECDSSQMAEYDIDNWLASLADILPSGAGRVVRNADNNLEITVFWDQNREGIAYVPGGANSDFENIELEITP